jgi:hypothetical protein
MIANTHEKTGIAFGTLSGNNVPELLDDIIAHGVNETHRSLMEELKNGIESNVSEAIRGEGPFSENDQERVVEAIKMAIKDAIGDWHSRPEDLLKTLDIESIFECSLAANGAFDDSVIGSQEILDRLVNEGLLENYESDGENYHHILEDDPNGKIKVLLRWLGGAPLLYVVESPYVARCAWCSPCVPNGGDLNTPQPHGITAYCLSEEDMPEDWEGSVELLDEDTRKKHQS